jgi:hypothetical protein
VIVDEEIEQLDKLAAMQSATHGPQTATVLCAQIPMPAETPVIITKSPTVLPKATTNNAELLNPSKVTKVKKLSKQYSFDRKGKFTKVTKYVYARGPNGKFKAAMPVT